jgi:HEAT repeat protein
MNGITMSITSPLLKQLTELGDPNDGFDYLALEITAEHVPELIRIATRSFPKYAPVADEVFWTRVHAWRALGQLRAEAAIEPLVRLLAEADVDDEWALDDLPEALGIIGRAVIGPAREASLREGSEEQARWACVQAIREVAQLHPDARGEAVEAMIGILREWPAQPPTFNAVVIDELLTLDVVEAAPLMQAAFEADAVDLRVTGGWASAQADLGLVSRRPPVEIRPPLPPRWGLPDAHASAPTGPAKPKAKVKNRRKDAKAARKRNRRR